MVAVIDIQTGLEELLDFLRITVPRSVMEGTHQEGSNRMNLIPPSGNLLRRLASSKRSQRSTIFRAADFNRTGAGLDCGTSSHHPELRHLKLIWGRVIEKPSYMDAATGGAI